MKNYLLGYDIGSSSIKASLLNADTGELISSAFSPKQEMKIDSPKSGWAEQHPNTWWENVINATKEILTDIDNNYKIHGIGISYQMHGLVLVDKKQEVLYPSIIWCDSRSVETGQNISSQVGADECLNSYLNLPGNFTASKLKWIKDNLPDVYKKIYKFMLPGDFIAMKLTGKITTTVSGLSEGIMWNFDKQEPAYELFEKLGLDKNFIADIVPTFGEQGKVTETAAKQLGIQEGIPVTYRAGDQPNNALSLNVIRDGEVAATAGTSGVVYGVTYDKFIDQASRVNSFAHVNYTKDEPSTGVLLCINGTAILYRWLKTEMFGNHYTYEEMNKLCGEVTEGSDGLFTLPFGNGAERILENQNVQSGLIGIDFNKHRIKHIIRSGFEGIVFSFRYGLKIMKENGMDINIVKVGNANLFLSKEFAQIFASACNVDVEIYNTDGAQGAARGAGIGCKFYENYDTAFNNLKKIGHIKPNADKVKKYDEFYKEWEKILFKFYISNV